MRFSANLGFLWCEMPLADAIRAARAAGFDAVEMHWPYAEGIDSLAEALEETSLPLLGLNTRRGNFEDGENGLSALPGREAEARAAIDEAIAFATELGAKAVHVMAGAAKGEDAQDCFERNLRYAADLAKPQDLTILIEPLNQHDAPGYFLQNTAHACEIIDSLGSNTVKLMFDCYHVARTEGDVATCLRTCFPYVGHIQFAGVPDRGRPDRGAVNFHDILSLAAELGWQEPVGAEYKPVGPTERTLDWMALFSAI